MRAGVAAPVSKDVNALLEKDAAAATVVKPDYLLAELPTMQALWARLSNGPIEILAINVGEDRSTIDKFMNRFDPPLGFPILIDLNMQMANEWRVRGIPTTYVVNRQGRLAEFAEGGMDFTDDFVVGKIRQLMYEGG